MGTTQEAETEEIRGPLWERIVGSLLIAAPFFLIWNCLGRPPAQRGIAALGFAVVASTAWTV